MGNEDERKMGVEVEVKKRKRWDEKLQIFPLNAASHSVAALGHETCSRL